MEAKKFCVLTTGRCGSRAFFRALEQHTNIISPTKQIGAGSRELLHHDHIKERYTQYSELVKRQVKTQSELIEAFYESNETVEYSGFKTLYHFVDDWEDFLKRDLQWIILTREDLASQIASFRLALKTTDWINEDPKRSRHWSFLHSETNHVKALGNDILKQQKILSQIEGIHITYEQLTKPNFSNSKLNEFFGAPIQLIDPQGPTSAEDYCLNWLTFKQFVDEQILSAVAA